MGSTLTVDFSEARDAMDVQCELARVLGLPEHYGHNWDAFWDCISSNCPLPDRLLVEGLDHLEAALPREAALFLRCLDDYNSSGEHRCCTETTDSYAGSIVFVCVEAAPKRLEPSGPRGAMVTGWLKRDDLIEAQSDAIQAIEAGGWRPVDIEEAYFVGIEVYPEGAAGRELFKQACIDGAAYMFHTWDTDGEA